jgi:Zn-dependent M28 family amino/carboxypeptidase
MKRIFLYLLLFLFLFQPAKTQQIQPVPESQLINAKQLLQDLETLSSDRMEGRRVGTPGGAKAREYVVRRFKETGVQAFKESYVQPFDFTNRNNEKIQGANVVGFVRGKKNPERYIVVSAHYDHLGIRNGEIYNGADDDASGTSALFAFAEYFSKNRPANSIIFVAFDAEEAGLQGARKFVEQLPVKKEFVLLNVNMDMIAHNDRNELYASGTRHYPYLKTFLEPIAKGATVKLLLGHDAPNPPQDDWTNQSDHYAFHQAKIPFIYFGVEDHKDYHKPTDDFKNINQAFYVRAAETILTTIKSFDRNLLKSEL